MSLLLLSISHRKTILLFWFWRKLTIHRKMSLLLILTKSHKSQINILVILTECHKSQEKMSLLFRLIVEIIDKYISNFD